MEESNNSSVVDFPENFIDQLLWEDCREEGDASLWSTLGLKERVTCAMGHLQEMMGGEKELLIQLWVPVERGRRRVLSTEEQPYSLSQSQSLALYRDISAGYSFAAEVGSDQLVGLPGRVFLNRRPEWTPDVRFLRSEEYLRIGYAHRYQVRASLALPLFQGPSGNCLGVLEMVTTHPSLEYGSQLHTICHALQAFDLWSSETSIVPTSLKPHSDDPDGFNQRPIIDSLASQLSLRFQSSPHLMVDDQLEEEVKDTHTTDHSSEQLVAEDSSPWMSRMSPKSVSWEMKLGEGVIEPSLSSSSLESRKRKTRAEKDITLDNLRQHFAGSLKDAAKNIGVCPTTLKRICRQHGISRWPSRKIKKVGHSLRKLKVVMDSVEGVQGSLHLASFYSSFPQLSLPLLDPKPKTVHFPAKSPPSSSSGSSTCCSSEEKQLGGFHQPAQLLTLSSLKKDEQRAVRGTSSLPPLPSARKAKEDGMKVNVVFGDSKMRMSLKHHWGIADLRREIAKGFGMDGDALTSNFSLKYMDDDEEWVLLTCDADLEECIQVYKSSLYKETVRISVSSLL
ncbi:unnamed protein product [Eruca vesicaria subsp. sativa]|uniref:Uncharacterized protein n=1 Tax=Eruca vesicaria subsp. sativa TaxID=29727 RepID=A0ABC8K4D2_ERUVS|nr:unnamed protein product [Eruca vesicaria subsp. sativa]